MEKVYNEAIAEKEAQFAEQEAQALYSHLESLRNRYGRKVTVLLGDRAPFCHHADLDISEEDIRAGTKMFLRSMRNSTPQPTTSSISAFTEYT